MTLSNRSRPRNRHGRIEGRKGQALRLARLEAEPLCRLCGKAGRVRAAVVPDHIVPLSRGGTEDEANVQCLCADCHDEKTAREMGCTRLTYGLDGWPVEG